VFGNKVEELPIVIEEKPMFGIDFNKLIGKKEIVPEPTIE
jgi:hypothetical protein